MRKRIMPKEYVYYCNICGNTIPKHRRQRARYCSDTCSTEAIRRDSKIRSYVDKTPYLKLRFKILARDGFTCHYCGRGVKDKVTLEVDHIRPLNRNGTNTENNLITACSDCNNGKKDILLSQRLERKIKESIADMA